MSARRTAMVAGLALACAAGATALVVASDHERGPVATALLSVPVGLAFVAAGLVASHRRPANRIGSLMTLVGFTWFLGALTESNHSVIYTAGLLVGNLAFAFFGQLVLAYPSGRLRGRADRAIVAGVFLLVTVGQALLYLFGDPRREICSDCPENAIQITEEGTLGDALQLVWQLAGLALVVAAAQLLRRRWRGASPAKRRLLAPVYASAGATLVAIAAYLIARAAGDDAAERALWWVLLATLLAVPLAFLWGLLRVRLARAEVPRVLLTTADEPRPEEAQAALRQMLGDPTMQLVFWLPEQRTYVDANGDATELPPPSSGRAITPIAYGERPVAALVHDPSLSEEPELVEAVVAATRLAIEKDRSLQALRATEKRTGAILDAIPDLMFRIHENGDYLDYKAPTDRDLYAPQVLGTTVQERLPAKVADEIMERGRLALETGGVQTWEYELEIDGESRYYEARVAASGDDEFLLIVRDVSERRRVALDLERQRDFLNALANNTPSLLVLVDDHGVVAHRAANAAFERLVGIDPPDVGGQVFWEHFVAPEDRASVRERIEGAIAGAEDDQEWENRWLAASGEQPIVAWSCVALPPLDERRLFLVGGVDVTERNRQEAELRSSRARIVEAGDEERRRLERNLHDGAQQRLVALSLGLRLAQTRLTSDPGAAAQLLDSAREELTHALEELRELARGIHPAVLTDRGLEPALVAVAARSPVPVELDVPSERMPGPVEAAAYYVVSEALANVAKYAHATTAAVSVDQQNGRVVVEVRDDGIGGADPAAGTGLRGLADRVAALDGSLEVRSAAGEGTTVRAEIPLLDG